MGIAVIPAATGGGIKTVQRGLASTAGTVTITAVDIAKSFVTVYGTTSSGVVGGTASVAAANGSNSGSSGTFSTMNVGVYVHNSYNGSVYDANGTAKTSNAAASNYNANGQNVALNATALSGGTNNLVSAVTQGYLSNSTSLVVSGACRWEVVEFA
jgi:hypothetical protein